MDKSTLARPRFLESKWWLFLFGLIFMAIFYIFYFYRKSPNLIGTSSIYNYFHLYWVYIPLLIGFISILKSYILVFILSIFRIRSFFMRIFIFLLIYGFWLGIGIQLYYFESRYTDIAIVIIDGYSLSLMCASGITIFFILVLSSFRKR